MKLKDLSTKPQLIKITLDDEDTITEYGEGLEFWVYDKQPLTRYVKFMATESANPAELVEFCSELILDEDGSPVMHDGAILPTKLMIKTINKVVTQLGK